MINMLSISTDQLPLLTVVYVIKQLLTVFLIAGPIIVIFLSTIDILKIIIDVEKQKKAIAKFVKRILYCVILFFVPIIVDFVTQIFGYNFSNSNIWTEANGTTINTLNQLKIQEKKAYELANEDLISELEEDKKHEQELKKQEFENLIKNKEEQEKQEQTNNNSGTTSEITGGTREEMANYAKGFVGKLKYVYGGNSLTTGTDCSGFVQLIYSKYGITLPRSANDQSYAGKEVKIEDLKKGDLIFYGKSGTQATHVAMYIGNGQVVHASSPKIGTRISNMNYRTILRARRYIND